MQSIITTTRGLSKLSYFCETQFIADSYLMRSSINITTLIYQNCSYFYYCKKYLKRSICCYFTLTCKYFLFSIYFLLNCRECFFPSDISNMFFCGIFEHICSSQINQYIFLINHIQCRH